MKKVLNVLLVAMLIISLTTVAFAAERGQTVEVTFTASGNPGFAALAANFNYDSNVLEYVSATPNLAGLKVNSKMMTYFGSEDVTGDIALCTVTFKVKDNAAFGTYNVSATVDSNSTFNYDYSPVSFAITGGSVTVECKNHVMSDWTEKSAATCDTAQVLERNCTVCGNKYETKNGTPATGHTYGDWEKVDDTNHKHTCSCGASETAAHTWDAGKITKPASCVDGEKTFTCTGCGATKVEPVKGTGVHTTNTWTDAGDGKTHKGTCSGCGLELTADHKWDFGTVTKQPSCNEAGVKTFKCTFNCGAEKTEEIKATGFHVYTDSYVDNKDGKTHTGVCACGTKSTVAQNHILVLKETINPDCKNDGKKVYECTVCKGIVETVLESTGKHNYETWTTDGDETHTSTCTGCGVEKKTEKHVWDAGKITTEPDCENKGVKTYTCTAKGCGQTKTEEVAAKGHKMQLTEKVAATCVAEGVEKYACANGCGETEEKKLPVDENAHKFAYTNNEATDNHTVTCENGCGKVNFQEDHNHNIFGGIVNGKQEKLCVCGDKIEVALGGNYADLDNVPKTGDITGQIVAFAACGMAALMAVAFVFKRKAAK